ncbi:MAG: hypothetical protein HQL08_09170 [Nitrospirae bacterium]|nr:hypothetical protein [Nitrospirota bacterium]
MVKTIACMMIVFILAPAAAFAQDTLKEEETIFDIIAVRPLALVSLTIGTAFFIGSIPLGVVSGSTGKAAKALVTDPFKYTFTRDLGDFDNSENKTDGHNSKGKNSLQ